MTAGIILSPSNQNILARCLWAVRVSFRSSLLVRVSPHYEVVYDIRPLSTSGLRVFLERHSADPSMDSQEYGTSGERAMSVELNGSFGEEGEVTVSREDLATRSWTVLLCTMRSWVALQLQSLYPRLGVYKRRADASVHDST